MPIEDIIIWAILAIESIVAGGILLHALGVWGDRRRPRGVKHVTEIVHTVCAQLSRGDEHPQQLLQSVLHRLGKEIDGLIGIMLSPKLSLDEVQADIRLHLAKHERGKLRILNLLIRTAPLAGLMGTLTGVSAALSAFALNPNDPRVVLAGFATAINTTLLGAAIACLAMFTAKLVVEPQLDRLDEALTRGTLEIRRCLSHLMVQQKRRELPVQLEQRRHRQKQKETAAIPDVAFPSHPATQAADRADKIKPPRPVQKEVQTLTPNLEHAFCAACI